MGCSSDTAADVRKRLNAQTTRWNDALVLAQQAPRLVLAERIADLQAIRRDVQAADWPDCAQPVADLLVETMDAYINAFVAALGGAATATVTAYNDAGNAALDRFYAALDALD